MRICTQSRQFNLFLGIIPNLCHRFSVHLYVYKYINKMSRFFIAYYFLPVYKVLYERKKTIHH